MIFSSYRSNIHTFISVLLLIASSGQATITDVVQGHSPNGRPVFLFGLEHWSNDQEAIRQAALLGALFKKKPDSVFLVEYNDSYKQLSPYKNIGKAAIRKMSYPHYTYAYRGLDTLVKKLTNQVVANNVLPTTTPKLKMQTTGLAVNQACPLTLFLDIVGSTNSDRLVHIDPRHQYLMLSALFTGIKKNPNIALEELVPDLGLDEDFLESFSLQDLVDTTDNLIHTLTTQPTNHAELTELMHEWAKCLAEHQEELKDALAELEESVCTNLNLNQSELNLQSPALVFVDRWLKTLQATEMLRTRSARAWHIQTHISRIDDLLSIIFNYHMHVNALAKFLTCTNTLNISQPIFLVAGTDHTMAVQFGLECIGYVFDRPLMCDEPRSAQTAPACTRILHQIFMTSEEAA